MTARLWIGLRSRVVYLRRLSVVMAVELRLKIVTELYMREMSPTQFYEEFGGGSLSRVTRNFERLEEHGWLRQFRSVGPGGRRYGGVEHFYRATELAVFDNATWALLPYSLRIGFSWTILKQLAERWRGAMEAATFDARPERHRTYTSLRLDHQGWKRILAAMDALFLSLSEEQADARLRVFRSLETPLTATVAFFAFESPGPSSGCVGPDLVEVRKDSLIPFFQRVAKVIADEVSIQILAETNQREMSATQFYREFGSELRSITANGVRGRFRMLVEKGWLKKVNEKTGGRRRGASEHFYRATGPAIRDDDVWTVPSSVRDTSSWATFERFSELAKEAMRAGTFDARADRHASWSLLRLDQQGWKNVAAGMDTLHEFVLKEQGLAGARMKKSGEKPIMTTVALAAFESPKTEAKEF